MPPKISKSKVKLPPEISKSKVKFKLPSEISKSKVKMPPKISKSKSKKGLKKKKSKVKKKKVVQSMPIHSLTELYNKLDLIIAQFYDKKTEFKKLREDAWKAILENEEGARHRNIYYNYLTNSLEDIQNTIDNIVDELTRLEEELEEELRKRLAPLNDRLAQLDTSILAKEKELLEVEHKLIEFQSLIREMEKLNKQLAELEAQIVAAEAQNDQKTRYLKNEYLEHRAQFYNYVEEQFLNLMQVLRKTIMTVLWEHMETSEEAHNCQRKAVARIDAISMAMNKKHEELLRERGRLVMKRPYWSISWAFQKLASAEYDRRQRYKEEKKKAKEVVPVPEPDGLFARSYKAFVAEKVRKDQARAEEEAKKKEQSEVNMRQKLPDVKSSATNVGNEAEEKEPSIEGNDEDEYVNFENFDNNEDDSDADKRDSADSDNDEKTDVTFQHQTEWSQTTWVEQDQESRLTTKIISEIR